MRRKSGQRLHKFRTFATHQQAVLEPDYGRRLAATDTETRRPEKEVAGP